MSITERGIVVLLLSASGYFLALFSVSLCMSLVQIAIVSLAGRLLYCKICGLLGCQPFCCLVSSRNVKLCLLFPASSVTLNPVRCQILSRGSVRPTHMFGLRVFAYLLSLPLMSASQAWREISLSEGKSQIYLQSKLELEFVLTVAGLLFVSLRTGTFVSICPFLMSTCHRNGGHGEGLLQQSTAAMAFSLGLPFCLLIMKLSS